MTTKHQMSMAEHTAAAFDRIFSGEKLRATGAECLLESDLTLSCGSHQICGGTLRVYGTHQERFPGSRETPEEPAGHEIERVTLSLAGEENDITMDDELERWILSQLEVRND